MDKCPECGMKYLETIEGYKEYDCGTLVSVIAIQQSPACKRICELQDKFDKAQAYIDKLQGRYE